MILDCFLILCLSIILLMSISNSGLILLYLRLLGSSFGQSDSVSHFAIIFFLLLMLPRVDRTAKKISEIIDIWSVKSRGSP